MADHASLDIEPLEGDPLSRGDTGIRILLSLVLALIWQVVEMVLLALVLFALGFALVTERAPGERVRRFANRVVSYGYRIGRYLTFNEARAPFPFSDWPDEVEPPRELADGEDEDD
jgi:hypothetical protein